MLVQVNYIIQRRSPMPYAQGGSQLAACGGQEETEGGVKLAFAVKLS
jgi:hypothetical protein